MPTPTDQRRATEDRVRTDLYAGERHREGGGDDGGEDGEERLRDAARWSELHREVHVGTRV